MSVISTFKIGLLRTGFACAALSAPLVCAPVFAAQAAVETPRLMVKTDHTDALYKVGQPVRFLVELALPASLKKTVKDPVVRWTLSQDGALVLDEGRAPLKNGRLEIEGKLDTPGFLRCDVELVEPETPKGKKAVVALVSAGIAPQALTPSLPPPSDFDAFWAAQKAIVRAEKIVPQLTAVKAASQKGQSLAAFDVQADLPQAIRLSGYLVYPADAKPGSLPAILTVHGAGVRSSLLATAVRWADEGMLAMDVNAHGVPNAQPASFYQDMFRTTLKNYHANVPQNRDEVYFRKMFMRVLGALDILAARPEWNGKVLVVYGTSQGGAQALAAGGLDERVSLVIAGVPAMCDHSGMLAGRISGWPRNVPKNPDGTQQANALEAMRYYDMVNFAANIKVPVAMTVGFIDKTCPPTTVYTAFNNLGGEKDIFNDIAAGHTNTPKATAFMRKHVLDHAGLSASETNQ